MKNIILVVFLISVGLGSLNAADDANFTETVAKIISETATIKPGQTRKDLLAVFKEEGGIYTSTQRRYAYKGCPYIKVDVVYKQIKETPYKLTESPEDTIVSISKPFLELATLD